MLVALSDTHSQDEPALTTNLQSAIEDAEIVTHTGDFTTETVLDRFEQLASRLVAVSGNRDRKAVRERVPAEQTVEWQGLRLLLVHGHGHDPTSLSMLARQEEADLVLTGHSHRPVIDSLGECPLLNPGSHADPRGNQAAYATVERGDESLSIQLLTPGGELLETKKV